MRSVLFVCTANICRSPMAEGLMKHKVLNKNEEWFVGSAGTWAINGEPAALNSQRAMQEMEIDIRSHRSRLVTRELLDSYQLVLTMESGHKEALRVEFPEYASRIYLLSEMVGKKFDIADPIGGPMVDFRETANEIDRIIMDGFKKIEILSGESLLES